MRPQRTPFRAKAGFYSFAEKYFQKNYLKGVKMYNNYLACEKCGAELTRENQKQQLDSEGFMHSYCASCYKEKFPNK